MWDAGAGERVWGKGQEGRVWGKRAKWKGKGQEGRDEVRRQLK
jgi:hypothetical protein